MGGMKAKPTAPQGGSYTARHTGHVYHGATPDTPHDYKLFTPARTTDIVRVECPVCGLRVSTRKDGSIGSHRVGRNRRNSWLCAGSGPITRPNGAEQ